MCVDWIFYILCYVNWIYLESDCYVNCLLRNGELKWMWMTCFEIDWLVNCCWEWCECGICWVEEWYIELCWWLKNNLSYWDCGLGICGYVLRWWTMWIVCVWW